MKKLLFFFIALILLAVSCGDSKKTENDTDILPDEDAVDEDPSEEEQDKDEEPEDESESSLPDKDLTPEDVVCNPNPCEEMPNSTGRCEFDGDRSFVCHCKKGYFWEDYKCVSPCEPNPCANIEHATTCSPIAKGEFECDCDKDFFWDGVKCMDPCDGKECPVHQHCRAWSHVTAKCICDENFFERGSECVGPCDPNPCKGLSHSSEKCIAEDEFEYTCECDKDYVFAMDEGCLNPCLPNKCEGKENSTSICYTINALDYSCHCKAGFFWSKETEECLQEMPQCSPENNGVCKDYDSGLIWSARAEMKKYPGNIDLLYVDEATAYCPTARDGGFTDWRLPTIDELRTLIINCPGLEPNGACKVRKGCLSESCYEEENCRCEGESYDTVFSKFGYEIYGSYWSSSVGGGFFEGERNWLIKIEGDADLYTHDPFNYPLGNWDPVRCVRK